MFLEISRTITVTLKRYKRNFEYRQDWVKKAWIKVPTAKRSMKIERRTNHQPSSTSSNERNRMSKTSVLPRRGGGIGDGSREAAIGNCVRLHNASRHTLDFVRTRTARQRSKDLLSTDDAVHRDSKELVTRQFLKYSRVQPYPVHRNLWILFIRFEPLSSTGTKLSSGGDLESHGFEDRWRRERYRRDIARSALQKGGSPWTVHACCSNAF